MPAHKKDHTTPKKSLATEADLPGQQEFHQHLRELIRGATRVVMEEIMREELALFLQAEWGEITPTRKGYRNGSYTRDLITATGQLEDRQRFPEIGKGSFIPRRLNATAAMSHK